MFLEYSQKDYRSPGVIEHLKPVWATITANKDKNVSGCMGDDRSINSCSTIYLHQSNVYGHL